MKPQVWHEILANHSSKRSCLTCFVYIEKSMGNAYQFLMPLDSAYLHFPAIYNIHTPNKSGVPHHV